MSAKKVIRKVVIRAVLVAGVGAAAWYGYGFFQTLQQRQEQIATTRVRQSDVIVRSYARGELRAVRSATLTAPNLFGTVQVTRMAPLGAYAREKDLVVEFDDSEVNSRLEEKQLEIDQIDEQIKKNTADLEIRSNQDKVELLSAQFSVRRAELEVKRNELLSAIDAKKNQLNLEEARRRLKQLESDIKSRQEQAQAQLAVLRENKNKALLELQRERQRLTQVKLLSPISGLVAVRQNRTGFMFPGMQIPDIREGDQVQPGIPVADVLDLSEMEIVAKVGELDRANLKEGQDASLMLDALPDKPLHARIKSMSGTASSNVFSFDPAKKFDVVFGIDMKELLSALGAKPERIQQILTTAEQNRRKPIAQASGSMLMGGGAEGFPTGGDAAAGGAGMAMQGGGASTGMAGGTGGDQSGEGGQGRQGRQGGGMRGMFGGGSNGSSPFAAMRNMTPEQQQQVRAAIQKAMGGKNPQDMSAEERQQMGTKIQAAIAEVMKKSGGAAAGAQDTKGGDRPGGRGEGGGQQSAGAQGPRTLPFAGGPGGGMRGMFGGGGGGTGQFSEKDLAEAKLPPPPEEDTQFDVLLRPGLLADVEIVVEKIPNAIHVPMQAIFESDGKPVVYVKRGGQFEVRFIKPLKRSESVMVIAEGLKPGEQVALSDPFEKKSDKKAEKKGEGGAMSALPGGGKK
jgi:HlyD family secretion protein